MASEVEVDVPAERVWAVLTDAARWAEWCGICDEVSRVPQEWVAGERLSFRLRMAGVSVPFNVTLEEVREGVLVSWASTKFSITAVRTISVTERGGMSMVRDWKGFSSPVMPVGLWYPRFLVRRMTEAWLGDLKLEAERG